MSEHESNGTEIEVYAAPNTKLIRKTMVAAPNAVVELREIRDTLTKMRDDMTAEWRAEDQEKRRWDNHPNHYDFESIVVQIQHLMGKLL